MNYKHSADSMAASIQGKINASKKTNFHKLGPGGYKVAIPKWEKMENDLIVKGIVPQTLSWPKRARYYFYSKFVLRVMRKSKKRAGQYIAS